MKHTNEYLPPNFKSLTYQELTALQKSLFQLAVGLPATAGVHPLLAQLPVIEPDRCVDIATSLCQIVEMLRVLESDLHRADLPLAERIDLEDAQARLVGTRQRLRREWEQAITVAYPARN